MSPLPVGFLATPRPSPTSRRPSRGRARATGIGSPSGSEGHFVEVFQFFFLSLKTLFPEEGPFCIGLTRSARGFCSPGLGSVVSNFRSEHSYRVTATSSFHSSFCRLSGPRVLRALIHI